jgi:hypothetical protein
MNTNSPEWTRVEPWLDEAMETLGEPDRTAILLRYFEDKSLREVGQALGMSEDAAQKRVSRAVEQLRNFLSKHGVTVGATSLVAAVSANAVQSAPLGLSSTISAAVTLSGAATHTATIGATKTILMTTMQKTLVATALAAAVGTGLYEALEISHLRSRVESFQQQQKALKDQLDQARQERDASATSLTAAQQQNETLRREIADLPKLRNEKARLREDSRESARLKAGIPAPDIDPAIEASLRTWARRTAQLKQRLEQMPDKKIPELQLLTEQNWFDAVKDAKHSRRRMISDRHWVNCELMQRWNLLNSFSRPFVHTWEPRAECFPAISPNSNLTFLQPSTMRY